MKPPPTPTLRARHRRMCRTCAKAPLPLLLASPKPRASSSSTTASTPPASPNPRPVFSDPRSPRAFTAPAFERTPCSCDAVVWLCAPCGKDLRNADTTYVRGWSWRTCYTRRLGGVGTGAGEGIEGVECGRSAACLGARIVEHETCEAETLAALDMAAASAAGSPDRWRGTSYLAQEIEGIGGVLKVKHKKQVRVGECVRSYEDERGKAIQYLPREVAGRLRSWCSWCERVVLSGWDREALDEGGDVLMRPGSSSGSSEASSGLLA